MKQEQIEETLGEMMLKIQQQQAQIDTLLDRSTALHSCLEDAGVIRPASYLARLHRQSFERMLWRHPCSCCDSFDALVQTSEMAFVLARLCGPEGVVSLAAASRTLDHHMREAQPRLTAFFSPAVYVIGGEGADEEVTCVVERLKPCASEWEPVASLPAPRAYCAAVAMGGMVYIVGGSDADSTMLSTVERYDPVQDVWEPMPPMQVARVAVAATAVGTRLVAVGGNNDLVVHNSVESFDPGLLSWSQLPRMW